MNFDIADVEIYALDFVKTNAPGTMSAWRPLSRESWSAGQVRPKLIERVEGLELLNVLNVLNVSNVVRTM